MTLGQSLFNALKGKLIRIVFISLILSHLEQLINNTVQQYQQTGMFHPFRNFESIAFTSHVTRGLREVVDDSVPSSRYLAYEDNRGVRIFRTWDTLVEELVGRLRRDGYSNIERAVDDIIFAVMCIAFWNYFMFMVSPEEQRISARTFANLLQLALDALSSEPQPGAVAGEGSGEPQPGAVAGEGSGEPQPGAVAGEGSGEPQPGAVAGEGSGEPQPGEGIVDVPMVNETVRGVRRYRLRDTPERELSRQRRARSRYGLRDTPARRER